MIESANFISCFYCRRRKVSLVINVSTWLYGPCGLWQLSFLHQNDFILATSIPFAPTDKMYLIVTLGHS